METNPNPQTIPTYNNSQNNSNSTGKNSFLLILFGVLLIVLSLFSTFLFIQNQKLKKGVVVPTPQPQETTGPTATPDITAEWQTYTDEVNNYMFKYPTGFTESPYIEGDYKGITVVYHGPDQGRKESMLADGVIVKTLVIKDADSVQEFAETQRERSLNVAPGDTPPTVSEIKTTNIMGSTAYYFSVTSGFGNSKVYFVDLNGSVLQIVVLYAGIEEDTTEYLKTADAILATFSTKP